MMKISNYPSKKEKNNTKIDTIRSQINGMIDKVYFQSVENNNSFQFDMYTLCTHATRLYCTVSDIYIHLLAVSV